jgi:hypothetical protein
MTMKGPAYIAWSLALIIVAGCSRPETVEVSGAVTWEGAPVPHGDITFFDVDPHVPAAAGKIVEGSYTFQCKPGKKRIEITSWRPSGKKTPEGKSIGEMYIPTQYNTDSTLTSDVTLDGDNVFNFNMQP